MAIRPQTYTTSSLVEKHINTSYDTVRQVALNLSDINIVAAAEASINAVAADTTDIGAVSGSLASVNTVATDIANVNTVAVDIGLGKIDAAVAAAISTANDLTAVQTIYDNFDDRYLGAFAVEPTLDNDGQALVIGAIFFDTATDETKFYNGAVWEAPELTATQAAAAAQTAQGLSETAQTAAELALDSFDDRWLGAKAVDPTLDNDGQALLTGASYFNTVLNQIKVYDGASWGIIGIAGIVSNANATAITIDASENTIFGGDVKSKLFQFSANTAPTWDTSSYIWFEGGFGTRYDGYAHKFDVGVARSTSLTLDNAGNATFGGDVIVPNGNLALGTNDTTSGTLSLYGSAVAEGGEIRMFNAADSDTNFDNWVIDSFGETLRFIGQVTALTLTGTTGNATFGGNVSLVDSKFLYIGTGNDLQIDHNGTNSNIVNTTGTLGLFEFVNSGLITMSSYNSVGTLKTGVTVGGATPDVSLYYDGAVRLSTATYGIDLSGTTAPAIQWDVNDYIAYDKTTNTHSLFVGGGAAKISVDGTATAGQTAMLLYDVDNATLERVTVGAADSGGAGFKVLRIPN